MLTIYFLIIQSVFSLIKLKENLNLAGKLVPKNKTLIILDNKLESWYQIFENKKHIVYSPSDYTHVPVLVAM